MNTRIRNSSVLTIAIVAVATLAFTADSAKATLTSQLGVLDLNANGGINPATGAAWQAGDTYRLIFASSAGRDATSTNIADYNAFIQGLANASPLGLSSVTWNALGSTETVDARDNTNTNINVDGPGESFWLMNGTEFIAANYADFYPNHADGVNIDISETGGAPFDGGDFTSVWTGSNGNGQAKVNPPVFGGNNWLGSNDGGTQGVGPTSNTGLFGTGSAAQWIDRFSIANSEVKGLYGVSEVLTVQGPPSGTAPEPSTLLLAAFGLMGLMGTRRRRNRK